MKQITLSAQEDALERAQRIAALKNKSLNELFREWLNDLKNHETKKSASRKIQALWKRTNYLHVGKKLTREAMNER